MELHTCTLALAYRIVHQRICLMGRSAVPSLRRTNVTRLIHIGCLVKPVAIAKASSQHLSNDSVCLGTFVELMRSKRMWCPFHHTTIFNSLLYCLYIVYFFHVKGRGDHFYHTTWLKSVCGDLTVDVEERHHFVLVVSRAISSCLFGVVWVSRYHTH